MSTKTVRYRRQQGEPAWTSKITGQSYSGSGNKGVAVRLPQHKVLGTGKWLGRNLGVGNVVTLPAKRVSAA